MLLKYLLLLWEIDWFSSDECGGECIKSNSLCSVPFEEVYLLLRFAIDASTADFDDDSNEDAAAADAGEVGLFSTIVATRDKTSSGDSGGSCSSQLLVLDIPENQTFFETWYYVWKQSIFDWKFEYVCFLISSIKGTWIKLILHDLDTNILSPFR